MGALPGISSVPDLAMIHPPYLGMACLRANTLLDVTAVEDMSMLVRARFYPPTLTCVEYAQVRRHEHWCLGCEAVVG